MADTTSFHIRQVHSDSTAQPHSDSCHEMWPLIIFSDRWNHTKIWHRCCAANHWEALPGKLARGQIALLVLMLWLKCYFVSSFMFQIACQTLDIDLISLDMTQKLPFYIKRSFVHVVGAAKHTSLCNNLKASEWQQKSLTPGVMDFCCQSRRACSWPQPFYWIGSRQRHPLWDLLLTNDCWWICEGLHHFNRPVIGQTVQGQGQPFLEHWKWFLFMRFPCHICFLFVLMVHLHFIAEYHHQ